MVDYWIASISANKPQENDELIRRLFSRNQIFGFRNLKTIEKDDSICFYSTFSRGIIANAMVSSKIQENPKLISDDYPYVIKLVDVSVYPTNPVLLTNDLIRELDAFKTRSPVRWSWFVWQPHRITKHDYDLLTRA